MLTKKQLREFTRFSHELALEAGQLLLRKSRKTGTVQYKGRVNLVTDADLASEKKIVAAISRTWPDHSILAEEGAAREKKSDFRWIIDPLDGTTNFAHNFPFYCVSIALEYRDEIICGTVYDPEREELYYAARGNGAFLNRKRISVSKSTKLEKSLLATGFPYDIGTSSENNLGNFNRFAQKAQAIRRAGSAALDLCYLACGRFDGFWELKLHPWDTAAGRVIVEEAGGRVTDFQGRKYSIYDKYILVSNGRIHGQMRHLLNQK